MKTVISNIVAAVRSVGSGSEPAARIRGAVAPFPTGGAVGLPAADRPRLSEAELQEALIKSRTAELVPGAPNYRERGAAPHFPPPAITQNLLARAGVVLLDPSVTAELRRLQRRLDELTRKIRALTAEEISRGRKAARLRIAAGKEKCGDEIYLLGADGLREALRRRKTLKLQRNSILEECAVIHFGIAERLQTIALQAMPALEKEDQEAYRAWANDTAGWRASEQVRAVALLTWSPTIVAKSSVMSPKSFLAQLGIELGKQTTNNSDTKGRNENL